MAVYCHQCGTGLPPTARFCSNCGSTVYVAQPMPGRPLMRPREGRQIAGVCLALARANGWDVAVVRILTVIGVCVSGGDRPPQVVVGHAVDDLVDAELPGVRLRERRGRPLQADAYPGRRARNAR